LIALFIETNSLYIAMPVMIARLSLVLRLAVTFYTALASAAAQEPLGIAQPGYKVGQPIPVSCLNRTMYDKPL
jgi:hypothetical protein